VLLGSNVARTIKGALRRSVGPSALSCALAAQLFGLAASAASPARRQRDRCAFEAPRRRDVRLVRREPRLTRSKAHACVLFAAPCPRAGNIIDLQQFDGQIDALMCVRCQRSAPRPSLSDRAHPTHTHRLGMMCALVGSSVWVNNATRLGLAVSSSHSIVGATIGVGIAFRGPSAVLWGACRSLGLRCLG
jgi:hypothetical protein